MTTYRRQAWNFVFSGGGLFNNLDYSFTVVAKTGANVEQSTRRRQSGTASAVEGVK